MNLRQGKVSFQSNDRSDIFLVLEVWENGVERSDEMRIGITDPQFESDHAWVSGKVPQMNQVNVSGDTTVVHAWFTAETLSPPPTKLKAPFCVAAATAIAMDLVPF